MRMTPPRAPGAVPGGPFQYPAGPLGGGAPSVRKGKAGAKPPHGPLGPPGIAHAANAAVPCGLAGSMACPLALALSVLVGTCAICNAPAPASTYGAALASAYASTCAMRTCVYCNRTLGGNIPMQPALASRSTEAPRASAALRPGRRHAPPVATPQDVGTGRAPGCGRMRRRGPG